MSDNNKNSIAIIGGGAAALYLATMLDTEKYKVTIYEKNKALGRKFLVAGQGGFNLTHAEPCEAILRKYHPAGFLDECISKFDNESKRRYLEDLGIPTYVGSSKRIFPLKGMKPIEVLQKFQDRLLTKSVEWHSENNWTGWSATGKILINNETELNADIVVFCLGGASWKVTGSDGSWLSHFHRRKVKIKPFQASNSAHMVAWPEEFAEKFQGQPLKNIAVRIGPKSHKGELVLTTTGLEGNALYALSPEIRAEYKSSKTAKIFLDLKPTLDRETILLKLERSTKNTTEVLRRDLKLSPVMLALVKLLVAKEAFMDNYLLAEQIKNLPITLIKAGPIDKAISTVGGIDLSEVNNNFELKKIPDHYCLGEMLDWDAPTGGYLLQACYSMAGILSDHLNQLA